MKNSLKHDNIANIQWQKKKTNLKKIELHYKYIFNKKKFQRWIILHFILSVYNWVFASDLVINFFIFNKMCTKKCFYTILARNDF